MLSCAARWTAHGELVVGSWWWAVDREHLVYGSGCIHLEMAGAVVEQLVVGS